MYVCRALVTLYPIGRPVKATITLRPVRATITLRPVRATITLYPLVRPVRATITLYPLARPVRATITLYPIGRPVAYSSKNRGVNYFLLSVALIHFSFQLVPSDTQLTVLATLTPSY